MTNFDKIPIASTLPEESPIHSNKNIPENKESKNSETKNNPDNITRRKAIKRFLAGTAALAILGNAEKIGTTADTLRAMIKYAMTSPTKEKLSELEELRDQIKQEYAPSAEMQTLAYEIQGKARQLLKDNDFFPKELFSDNFFSAIQIQESQLKPYAQSNKKALGKMQVKPITIKEVVRYLNILETKDVIEFEGPQMEDLSAKDVIGLEFLTRENGDLGEAFGKLYFADLFNNFEIGKETFSSGKITEAHIKLLTAYNWNPDSFKRNESNETVWPPESKEYCRKILANMSSLNIIQGEIAKLKMKTNAQELSELLTIELNRYDSLDTQSPLFAKIAHSYLTMILIIENVHGKPLKVKEIKSILNKRNPTAYRVYANHNYNRKTLN